MVYKGCDLGSAKPEPNILSKHPHHLIDCIEPDSIFTVADFYKQSIDLIDKIHRKDKLPLFVGGSMMYFRSLLSGLDDLPHRNQTYRQELEDIKDKKGLEILYSKLLKEDSIYAKKIQPSDEQRIVRALEVIELTGKPFSSLIGLKNKNLLKDKFNIKQYAIYEEDRSLLHSRIEDRLKNIIESGLVNEVNELFTKYDIPKDHPIRKSVNYKQAIGFINKDYDADEFFNKALYATRQLAKRQITWLRSWDDINFYDIKSKNIIKEDIKRLVTSL